jgi:hypothetical protein
MEAMNDSWPAFRARAGATGWLHWDRVIVHAAIAFRAAPWEARSNPRGLTL